MKRQNSPHVVSPKAEVSPLTRKPTDYRETGAVGRRSSIRKMGIAGASLAPVLALLVASSAMAGDELEFKGGIGVIPVASVGSTGAVVANVVRGINPALDPWRIRALSAEVKADGRIHVEGRGLLLAGGNGIGTNGGVSVFASLICALPNGTFAVHSTPVAKAVKLAADGDFTIDDVLSSPPSTSCDNPVLLIQNAATGVWFAAGIPQVFED